MEQLIQIKNQNILYPAGIASSSENRAWIVFATCSTEGEDNRGRVIAKATDTGREICITPDESDYSSVKCISDREHIWVTFIEYASQKKCVWLACLKADRVDMLCKVTDCGRFDNPEIAIHQGKIYVAWESYESGKSEIYYAAADESDICYKATGGEETAYRPVMLSDGNHLYMAYELFYNKRYHLAVRILDQDGSSFSNPVEIGFDEKNDQQPSLCLYKGRVLVAWENSSPLEKNFVWDALWGEKIIMPAFGHGWRVRTRVGLRRIHFHDGQWIVENLTGKENASPLVLLDPQESSGCPRVFADQNGIIYIAYLALTGRWGWQIRLKYYNGSGWVEFHEETLIQKQRVPPAVLVEDNSSQILMAGNHIETENRGLSQENRVTYFQKIRKPLIYENIEPEFRPIDKVRIVDAYTTHKVIPFIYSIKSNEGDLKVFWGDLHMHSNLSGCSVTNDFHCTEIEEKYRFCKDVAKLDFAMCTDHDNMSVSEWNRTRKAAHFNNIPGIFTAFAGFEWTCTHFQNKANYGHYNILYKEDGQILRTSNPEQDSIEKLWKTFEKGKVLSIPHHPGEECHRLDWNFFNEDFERLVEIFQVRGSYEFDGCPLDPSNYNRRTVKNNSVRYGLNRGYKFGFTSGGEHEGVGVTAVYAKELTRESIFEALQKRHTYGTTGDHIIVDFRINGYLMGSEIKIKNENPEVYINVAGTDMIKNIQLIRDSKCIQEWTPTGKDVCLEWVDDTFNKTQDVPHHYYYIVLTQANGEMAWASPVFVKCS